MKKFLFLLSTLLLTTTMMTSCFKDKPDTSQKGLYVGIIGFNDDLNTNTLQILNATTKNEMVDFINGLTMKNGTALYHAVNTALDKIESVTPPEDLVNVSIVTFTDGLDQGSYMLNDQYNSGEAYVNAVSNRIKTDYVGDNRIPIDAYSIGVANDDVNPVTFRQSLEKLSSDKDNNVFLVDSMAQISEIFASIAQNLYHESSIWEVTLKTPAPEHNTRIRFTFDKVSSADESELYVEGVFINDNGTCVLNNITYHGLQNCGDMIYPTSEGMFMLFTFPDLYTLEGEQVTTTDAKQWNWNNQTEEWEYKPEGVNSGNIVIEKDFKSAMIMLVLDCSSSLGDDFETVKSAARQFIETLNGNTHQE